MMARAGCSRCASSVLPRAPRTRRAASCSACPRKRLPGARRRRSCRCARFRARSCFGIRPVRSQRRIDMVTFSTEKTDVVAMAVTSIAGVSAGIEEAFAETGDRLSQGHRIFKDLEASLVVLAQELSGAGIESAARALQNIADRLND